VTRDPLPTLAALARLATPITRASVADRAPELIVSPHVVAKAEAVRLATLDAIGRWAVPPYDRLPEVPPAYEPVVLAVLARSCAFGLERDHAAWGLERLVRMEGRATRVVDIGGRPVRVVERPRPAAVAPAPTPSPAHPPFRARGPPTANGAPSCTPTSSTSTPRPVRP
jgi:hypothetical protein